MDTDADAKGVLIVIPLLRRGELKTMPADVGSLGWRAGASDTTLKGDHPRTIPTKFGPNGPSCF